MRILNLVFCQLLSIFSFKSSPCLTRQKVPSTWFCVNAPPKGLTQVSTKLGECQSTYCWKGIKCCFSSSSTLPCTISVISITRKKINLIKETNCWASQVGLVVKNLPANTWDIIDAGLILGLGRSSGGGRGSPLQYLLSPSSTVHVKLSQHC